MKIVITVLTFCLCTRLAFAQIMIAPSSVFLDPKTNKGIMTITNLTDQPREVSVSFRFGYLSCDSTGQPYILYDDSTAEQSKSLIPWLKAIPSKAIVGPEDELAVHLVVRQPAALPDGTYWTRMIVSSDNISNPIDDSSKEHRQNFNINTNVVGSVVSRKGMATTSLIIDTISHVLSGNTLDFWLGLNRNAGNSPFFGRITIVVRDDAGNEICSPDESNVAVYYVCRQKFSFDRACFKPGRYHAEFTLDTERKDIPQHYIIPTEKIVKTYDFVVGE